MSRSRKGSGWRCSRTLRATRAVAASTEKVAALVVATVAATASVLALPSLGAQLALVSAAVLSVVSLMMAQAGRFLNAAWVIVLGVYLIDAGGTVLTLVDSPAPMILVVAAAPLPFVLAALWLRPDAREHLVMIAPLVLLGALAALSLVWSPAVEVGSRKLVLWMATGLLPCVFMLILVSRTRPVSWRLLAAVAFAYSVTLLVIGAYTAAYPGRLVFFDSNPIWIARAAFIGALVVLFGPFPTILKIVLLPPMLLAGHLTDSLGPTLGLVIGAGFGAAEVIRTADATQRRSKIGWVLLGLVAGVVLTLSVAAAATADPSSLAPVADDPNVTSRAFFLETAARSFAASPIFGSGLGAFATTGLAEYPHNVFAEVASELGVIGLALLIVWVAMALRGAAGSPLLVSLVVATTMFALFSGSLASNTEFWLFTGVAVAMTPLRQRRAISSPAFAT